MQIKGFQEVTLMDWDGVVASIVFVGGCNFRCLYCHNYDIAFNSAEKEDVSQEFIFARLKELKKWIDGVIVCGGEPTIYGASLTLLLETLKAEGFKTKIYTNGTNNALLTDLIENKLLDAVDMDIKHVFSKYAQVTMADNHEMLEEVKNSISFLKSTKTIDVRFRTTVVKGIHTQNDIEEIYKLVHPCPLIIQNVSNEHVPEKYSNLVQPFTAKEFEELQKLIN